MSPHPLRLSARKLIPLAFTLIELLIVVAIIAILAAIAVPNFLEAQMRAKVSRAKSDLRTVATALEAYRVDQNDYADGTDGANAHDPALSAFLGARDTGFYTFRARTATGGIPGRDFATLTTPIAYITALTTDPFEAHASNLITYSYRNAKTTKDNYVLTSFGPDNDLFLDAGGKVGAGTLNPNPLGTAADTKVPARLGDINEAGVISYMEKSNAAMVSAVDAIGGLRAALEDLAYDPTNGTLSDGDIFRIP